MYSGDDLAQGNKLVFTVSGVTRGELLDGMNFTPHGASYPLRSEPPSEINI